MAVLARSKGPEPPGAKARASRFPETYRKKGISLYNCPRVKKTLSVILVSALLIGQPGSAGRAFARTILQAPTASPVPSLTAPLSLPGAGGVSAAGPSLTPSLGALPGVLPSLSRAPVNGPAGAPIGAVPVARAAAPVTNAPAAPLGTPKAAPAGPKSGPAAKVAAVTKSFQPDLKALKSPGVSAGRSWRAAGRVMDGTRAKGAATAVAAAAEGAGRSAPALSPSDSSWWRDASLTHNAVSLPIYALRRAEHDPGIGKFTDLGAYYRDALAKQGAKVIHLLPHFAVLDESPYAPVSLHALNEDNVDWAQVREVRRTPALLARTRNPGPGRKVDYPALRARESALAREAFEKFRADQLAKDTPRAEAYREFVQENRGWLEDYSEFMVLSRILGKPVLGWTESEIDAARGRPDFELLKETRFYTQWIARDQFREALDTIHEAGGKVLFDIPMFRAKNSVEAWKHPERFKDLKTRNPGIKNEWLDEDWGDLALWNWTAQRNAGYRDMLEPFEYWLDFGLDGARVDAIHFAYNFGNGQLVSGDEPGDDYVRALGEVFKRRGALPVAEAFEGKAPDAERHGFLTVYGDWKKLSSHDDKRSEGFMGKLMGLRGEGTSGRNARFVGYTLGDEWGDILPVKRSEKGRSLWRYRVPREGDPHYDRRVRDDVRAQLEGLKAMREGNVWKAAGAAWTAFKKAASTFVKHIEGTVRIWAASLDWFFEEWGRDTFIALPGLLLTTGRFEEARANMRNFAKYEHKGLIPNRIAQPELWSPEDPKGVEYNTVDGSMWFIQSLKRYGEYSKDRAFVAEMLPVLRSIVDNYASGTGYHRYGRFNRIYMDSDGLIVSPAQATWMDADPEGLDRPVTPRNGKVVEINALWYANLRYLARLEREAGNADAAARYDSMADLAKKSFNEKFWLETEDNKRVLGGSGGTLRDVVDGDLHGDAIRPNMLFAVSHGEDLLSPERQEAVVNAATKELLTPYGMRTLSPRDSHYNAIYETWKPPLEKDQAYHQGTVWPWLIGGYADALARVRRNQGWDEGRIRGELRGVMTPLVSFLLSASEGSLPEVFDGGRQDDRLLKFSLTDPAGLAGLITGMVTGQNRGGTRSQAWSVSEVMRVLWEHGLISRDRP